MSSMPYPYDAAQPASECQVAQAPEVPTAVVSKQDFPMYEMPTLMDGTFSHLVEVLEEAGLRPIGPAFALHHRAPVATADLEVGFPIDAPLTETLSLPSGYEVTGSVLAGRPRGLDLAPGRLWRAGREVGSVHRGHR